jgi:hypothetical protein
VQQASTAATFGTSAELGQHEEQQHEKHHHHQQQQAAPAIQLIRHTAAGGFELCPEAAAFLEAQGSKHLAVVSIAGETRCGKSYLLNRLAKTPRGFDVSSSSDPCTHGLWLLPQAVHSSASGEDCAVLFLDSEGTASFEVCAGVDAMNAAVTYGLLP